MSDDVAAGRPLSFSIDVAASTFNIQMFNLTGVTSQKDPKQPRTVRIYGLLASTLRQNGREVHRPDLKYDRLVQSEAAAADAYNAFLDDLKVTGEDVQRTAVFSVHQPQINNKGASC